VTPVPRLIFALVLAAYLLPLVQTVPLMEDDEGLHAAIAQEMVERGDWVVPRLMGEPFLDKPILYFWLQAASVAAFGASEFAVRLPGTLTALAGAVAIGWLARTMFGAAAGAWAALAYATMLLPYAVSLAPLHDLVMVPLAVIAVGAFWHARYTTRPAALAAWTVVAGVALGLSMLGKGLTGVGLVGPGVAVWLLWTRALSWRLVVVGAASLGIAALIAWPWYAAMEQASPGYLHYFFLERHVAGVTDDTQRHAGRPFWYYLPILLVGTWPWLVHAWRRPGSDAERLLMCWFVADVLLLSAAGSKLATYVLPALPAVAALAGAQIASSETAPAIPRVVLVGMALVPLAALGYLATQPGMEVSPAYWIGAMAPILAALAIVRHAAAHPRWTPAVQAVAVTAITLIGAAALVRPVIAESLTARTLAGQFNAGAALPEYVWVVDEGVGSLVFYLRPDLRHGLRRAQIRRISRFSTPDLIRESNAGMIAVAPDRVDGLAEILALDGMPRPTGGQFMLIPRAALRVRAAPASAAR
jgi:4-amino-4-deoxy-L-arabinose transferase-like glycosyltransferase